MMLSKKQLTLDEYIDYLIYKSVWDKTITQPYRYKLGSIEELKKIHPIISKKIIGYTLIYEVQHQYGAWRKRMSYSIILNNYREIKLKELGI